MLEVTTRSIDDSLRALERRVDPGDEGAREAWAHALERAGRTDDAWLVRLGADLRASDREARLARTAWASVDGDPGRSRWVDVPPLATAPGERWSVELQPRDVRRPGRLLACSAGVVVLGAPGLVVLELATGARRTGDPTVVGASLVAGGLMTVCQERGRVFARLRERGGEWGVLAEGGFDERPIDVSDVATFLRPGGLPLVAVSDPARGPLRLGECAAVGRAGGDVHLTDEALVVVGPQRIAVIARSSGQALGEHHGHPPAITRSGALAFAPWGHAGLLVVDLTSGQQRCLLVDEAGLPESVRGLASVPLALSPTHLVAAQRRRSGLERVAVSLEASRIARLGAQGPGCVVAARDVVYACDPGVLRATRVDGEALWSLPGAFDALAPVPGGLVALSRDAAGTRVVRLG